MPQLSQLARQFLTLTALLLALFFLKTLLVAQRQQAFIQLRQRCFTFLALKLKTLQFLTARQHAAVGFGSTAYAKKMPTDPIAVSADQAFAVRQLPTLCQRLLQ